jgi:predicted anti-sigma-YlaC factor YlaD
MNCLASRQLLQERLDGVPVESPDWLEHLRQCPDCRTLEAASRRLLEGMRPLAAPLPPPDLASRIAERVVLDRLRSRRRARRRWAVTLALAASLFVALALRLDWPRQLTGVESRHSAPVAAKNTPAPLEPAAEPPSLREAVTEASAAVAALTSHTAGETVESTRWLVPKVSAPDLPRVDLEAIEPPTGPLREAGEGVSAGLEPVTNSARRAFGLFLRELPPMDGEQKGL